MKVVITIIRWLTGILFIFSGLVKANDPLGLSYKMQEFFEAWGIQGFHQYTLALSILMNAFEIIAGVAVIIGWRMKLFSWLLLLLIVFFTFLTGYAWLATNPDGSAKFASCGCFGDCLPLTPEQSFEKDLLLLLFIALIFLYRKKVKPLFKQNWLNVVKISSTVIFSFALQWYTLTYLPIVDCLPFKKGNNILELRKMPADAVPDQFAYKFVYEKGGLRKEFDVSHLPDSSWKFIDRKQTLIVKGKNNEPRIKDFELKTTDGVDLTENILEQKETYYLLFVKNTDGLHAADQWIKALSAIAEKEKLFIVTAVPDAVHQLFVSDDFLSRQAVLVSDVTAIKTAARAVPVLYKMEGPVVVNKWSAADFKHVN